VFSRAMKLRIREIRQEQDLTIQDLADMAGVSRSYLNELELGAKTINAARLDQVARALKVDVVDLIAHEPRAISVAGRVGAGAQVPLFDHTESGGLFQVAEPPQLRRIARIHPLGAVEVEGDSMAPLYQPGDVLFFSRAVHDGMPNEDLGRICIVEDEAGDAWVKQVTIGTQPGLYHLLSHNPQALNRLDQRIKWAARVIMALPGDMVDRV